jgi:hypothetical protein
MLFPKLETWQKSRPQQLAELDSLVADFWREGITIYERLEIVLTIYNRCEEIRKSNGDESLSAALKQTQQYCDNVIGAAANTPVVTTFLRKQMMEKLKIDQSYLPNHLPSHLSEPRPAESREEFLRRRMSEHLAATAPRLYMKKGELTRLLYVTREKVESELMPQALKNIRDRDPTAKPLPDSIEIHAWSQDAILQYKAFEKSSTLETQDFSLREESRVIVNDGQLIRLQETSEGLEKVPADTSHHHSHGKDGWATFIINAKGEIFIHDHTESFMHSSFMADAPVLFAGEIKIANGKVVGISNYSGHYLPDEFEMAHALQHLKDKALDLSSCVIYSHSDSRLQEHENKEICPADEFAKYANMKHEMITELEAEMQSILQNKSEPDAERRNLVSHKLSLVKSTTSPRDMEMAIKAIEQRDILRNTIRKLSNEEQTETVRAEIKHLQLIEKILTIAKYSYLLENAFERIAFVNDIHATLTRAANREMNEAERMSIGKLQAAYDKLADASEISEITACMIRLRRMEKIHQRSLEPAADVEQLQTYFRMLEYSNTKEDFEIAGKGMALLDQINSKLDKFRNSNQTESVMMEIRHLESIRTLMAKANSSNELGLTLKKIEFLNEINTRLIDLNHDEKTRSVKKQIQILKTFYEKIQNTSEAEFDALIRNYIIHDLEYLKKYSNNASFLLQLASDYQDPSDRKLQSFIKQTRDDIGTMFEHIWLPHKSLYLKAVLDESPKRESSLFRQYAFYKDDLRHFAEPRRNFENNEEFRLRQSKHEALRLLHKKESALFQSKSNKQLLRTKSREIKEASSIQELQARLDEIKAEYRPHHGIYAIANFIKTRVLQKDEKRREDTKTYQSVEKIETNLKSR